MKIDLPSGAWADLLTPDKLKSRHLRLVNRAVTSTTQRTGGRILDLLDGCIAIVVQEWSCTDDNGNVLPVPSIEPDSLDEMTIEDYETLLQHPYVTEIGQRIIKVRSETITPDDYDDPESPTEPSVASGPDWGEQTSHPTTTAGLNGTKNKSTSRSRNGGTGTRRK